MCILTSEMCILVYDDFVVFLIPCVSYYYYATMQQISALKHHLLIIFWDLGTARGHCSCTSLSIAETLPVLFQSSLHQTPQLPESTELSESTMITLGIHTLIIKHMLFPRPIFYKQDLWFCLHLLFLLSGQKKHRISPSFIKISQRPVIASLVQGK